MYPTEEETDLWITLNLVQRTIYNAMDSALGAEQLPPLRWYDVLWELERADPEGMRQFELGAKHIFHQSNLSRLLKRMIGEGLIEEFVYESDRRGKILRITNKGRTIRMRMWEIYGPLIHENMSRIADLNKLKEVTAALKPLSKKG